MGFEITTRDGRAERARRVRLASVWETLEDGVKPGVRLLPNELSHVLAVQSLPPHHGDPFDRLLIAQAGIEGLALVSRDAAFDDYAVGRLW